MRLARDANEAAMNIAFKYADGELSKADALDDLKAEGFSRNEARKLLSASVEVQKSKR